VLLGTFLRCQVLEFLPLLEGWVNDALQDREEEEEGGGEGGGEEGEDKGERGVVGRGMGGGHFGTELVEGLYLGVLDDLPRGEARKVVHALCLPCRYWGCHLYWPAATAAGSAVLP